MPSSLDIHEIHQHQKAWWGILPLPLLQILDLLPCDLWSSRSAQYLKCVSEQTHPSYEKIDPSCFKCLFQKGKRDETKRVKAVLWDNNYRSSFISSCERSLSKQPTDPLSNGFVVLPYVQGVSERIRRILRQQQVKGAFKPLRTLNSLFPWPKAQEKVDRPQSGTVYKISCTNCSFAHYGQNERSLKTRIAEHNRAVSMFDHNSKISCHVHENNHKINFANVRVVGHAGSQIKVTRLTHCHHIFSRENILTPARAWHLLFPQLASMESTLGNLLSAVNIPFPKTKEAYFVLAIINECNEV